MRGLGLFMIAWLVFFPLRQADGQPKNTTLAQNSQEILILGEQAKQDYANKDYESAIFKFNQILLSQPSDEEALRLRELIGNELMMDMLMRQGEISRIARALLLYAEKAPIRRETNPETIIQLVKTAATGNLYQKSDAIALLEAQVGELAIPHMLPYLENSTNDTERINIILAITKMGRSVVIPLIEALQTNNTFLRQQVAILLGHIKDTRALADLKKLIEDPREDASVKQYARNSIQQIAQTASVALPSAKALYYEKALGYYRDELFYRPTVNFNWIYWRWQDNALVYQEVPSFVYNEIMAEHACYKALELDSTFKNAWALLVRVYYAQSTEIQAVEDANIEKGIQIPAEDLAKFTKEKPFAAKAKELALSAGLEILQLALKDSLSPKEKRVEVSVKILEAIGDLGQSRGDLPPVLLPCLLHKDKRIRYASAETIVKLNPNRSFSEAPRVVQILCEALEAWDNRVVLVIEKDDNIRNQILDLLLQMNLIGIPVTTGSEGLSKAQSFPPEDLILLSSEVEDMPTASFLSALQESFQSQGMPVLILTPEMKQKKIAEQYQNLPYVKGVLGQPMVNLDLKAAIERTLEASKSGYKNQAMQVAVRATQAIASLRPENFLFPYLKESVPTLCKVLGSRHDAVRLPALMALGNIGDAQAIPAITELLVNPEVVLQTRIVAAQALGHILTKTQTALKAEEMRRITSLLDEKAKSTDEAQKQLQELFHQRIYALLGKANLSPELRREIFLNYRVHKMIEVQAKEKTPIVKEEPKEVKPTVPEKTKEDSVWGEDESEKESTSTQTDSENEKSFKDETTESQKEKSVKNETTDSENEKSFKDETTESEKEKPLEDEKLEED